MTVYEGLSSESTINLGWENVTNLKYKFSKNLRNSNILKLNWSPVISYSEEVTIKYIITFKNEIFITTEASFNVPLSYGKFTIDSITGKNIIEKECLTIETRFYFEDNTYSSSNTQEICFCPPIDPACSKPKITKSVLTKKSGNKSLKIKYSSAVKNVNGAVAIDGNIFGCSQPSHWASLNLGIGPNDCYKKDDVKILPSVSDNPQYQVRVRGRRR